MKERITMDCGEGVKLLEIELSDSHSAEMLVTQLGPHRYRMEESSVLGEVNYHDIIVTREIAERRVRLLRIEAPSGFKVDTRVLSRAFIETPFFLEFLDRVTAAEGHWERFWGGCITIHLPPSEGHLMDEFDNKCRDV